MAICSTVKRPTNNRAVHLILIIYIIEKTGQSICSIYRRVYRPLVWVYVLNCLLGRLGRYPRSTVKAYRPGLFARKSHHPTTHFSWLWLAKWDIFPFISCLIPEKELRLVLNRCLSISYFLPSPRHHRQRYITREFIPGIKLWCLRLELATLLGERRKPLYPSCEQTGQAGLAHSGRRQTEQKIDILRQIHVPACLLDSQIARIKHMVTCFALRE